MANIRKANRRKRRMLTEEKDTYGLPRLAKQKARHSHAGLLITIPAIGISLFDYRHWIYLAEDFFTKP